MFTLIFGVSLITFGHTVYIPCGNNINISIWSCVQLEIITRMKTKLAHLQFEKEKDGLKYKKIVVVINKIKISQRISCENEVHYYYNGSILRSAEYVLMLQNVIQEITSPPHCIKIDVWCGFIEVLIVILIFRTYFQQSMLSIRFLYKKICACCKFS